MPGYGVQIWKHPHTSNHCWPSSKESSWIPQTLLLKDPSAYEMCLFVYHIALHPAISQTRIYGTIPSSPARHNNERVSIRNTNTLAALLLTCFYLSTPIHSLHPQPRPVQSILGPWPLQGPPADGGIWCASEMSVTMGLEEKSNASLMCSQRVKGPLQQCCFVYIVNTKMSQNTKSFPLWLWSQFPECSPS